MYFTYYIFQFLESSKDSDEKIPADLIGSSLLEVPEYSQEDIYNETDTKQQGIDAQVACLRFVNFEKNQVRRLQSIKKVN